MAARHVQVTGRVQGVFFRAWTKGEAEELGVRGWVRNCNDGSVEAHLEGDEHSLEALIERMRAGPPDARVDSLSSNPATDQNFSAFELKH